MQMEDYMNEAPQRLLAMLEQRRDDLAQAARAVLNQGVTRIILTGSGTSYHGALTARRFMQQWCHVPVEVSYPFLLDSATLAQGGKALLIGISQGGGSLSTLEAMTRAREAGHITASMAGVENATIDRVADHVLTVPCGEEKAGAKTKGYLCTMLNLMQLALTLAEQRNAITPAQQEAVKARMANTFRHLPAVIDAAAAWAQGPARPLAESQDLRLVAQPELYGTVQEGALKLLETLRCPVSGYEFEEFIHGIYNAFNSGSALIMLDNRPDERSKNLVAILSQWTTHIYRIGSQVEENGKNMRFPFINDKDFSVFEYIIPLQMLCAKLAPEKGINPAIPKDPQFHQKMKSKQAA
ncbi:SIS domain-containing protein [Franconibacter pulveris]|uniref:SIS domain-containing protein n=1 Tax=Franconibacter pulveris TaxID=435910 RepID=UPI00049689FB|nr:SIS domain-containing protein [Franconibacter pulveris]